MPLSANFVQAERFQLQASAPLPLKKWLWQQIIKAKIKAQGELLNNLHKSDYGLIELSRKVKSGDSDNLEARASRIYWQELFKDPSFKRNREGADQNRYLNYGYTVLRATACRAICGAGLHPSLGLHHHNRYDAFCLADDLMEPFRPIVDAAVYTALDMFGTSAELNKVVKGVLLEALLGRLDFEEESRTLFDCLARTASSLVAVFAGEKKDLSLP